MTLARTYGEEIRLVFQEKPEKGKLCSVFQLSGTFLNYFNLLILLIIFHCYTDLRQIFHKCK